MKIVMAFDGLQVGGIETVGASYARLLRELGNEVTVINLNPSFSQMESEFPKDCKIIHCTYPRKLAPEKYAVLVEGGLLFKFAYPVIYILFSVANAMYKLFCRRKKLLRKQYDLSIAFAGHFNDLSFVRYDFVRADKKLCWLHGALYGYLVMSPGYLNLYKKIGNLIVLCDEAQNEVLVKKHNPKLEIHKLYNPTYIKGREIDQMVVDELRKKYGRFLIMVSRFSYPEKDHYTVSKALEIIRCKYKEELNLLFLGSGPEEEKVKTYVQSLKGDTSDHIFFMGNQKNMQDYYQSAYLLAHASVSGEGLPTVMLEAMMYSLPMVVTDAGVGPREIIQENEYGLLCRIQDPEDMAEKIVSLCRDRELYAHYQEKENERMKDFMPDTIKNQLASILNEI